MIIVQLDSEQLSGLIETAVAKGVQKLISENPSNATQSDSETLLTVQAAAKFLDLSVPTIYTKNSKGELPSIKNKGSKRLYFLKSDLIDFLKVGRKKTNREIENEAEKYLNKKTVTSFK